MFNTALNLNEEKLVKKSTEAAKCTTCFQKSIETI